MGSLILVRHATTDGVGRRAATSASAATCRCRRCGRASWPTGSGGPRRRAGRAAARRAAAGHAARRCAAARPPSRDRAARSASTRPDRGRARPAGDRLRRLGRPDRRGVPRARPRAARGLGGGSVRDPLPGGRERRGRRRARVAGARRRSRRGSPTTARAARSWSPTTTSTGSGCATCWAGRCASTGDRLSPGSGAATASSTFGGGDAGHPAHQRARPA